MPTEDRPEAPPRTDGPTGPAGAVAGAGAGSGKLTVTADSAFTEIEVWDGRSRLVPPPDGGNLGCVEYELPAGLYRVQIRARGSSDEQFVSVIPGKHREVAFRSPLRVLSAVPAEGTAAQIPEHRAAAAGEELAELMILVRDWDKVPLDKRPRVSLFAVDGTNDLLGAPVDDATWARWFATPRAGYYRLRITDADGRGTVEQALWLPALRQTQVFLVVQRHGPIVVRADKQSDAEKVVRLHVPMDSEKGVRAPAPDYMSIRIVPAGERFVGDEADIAHSERAVFALNDSRAVPGSRWDPPKFDPNRPMLGLYTAFLLHRYLRHRHPEDQGAENLRGEEWGPLAELLGAFADAFAPQSPVDIVALARQLFPIGSEPIAFVPMLRDAWRLLLEATADRASIGLIPADSPAARLAPYVRAAGGIWLSWVPPPAANVRTERPHPTWVQEVQHLAGTVRRAFIDHPELAAELYGDRELSVVNRRLVGFLYPACTEPLWWRAVESDPKQREQERDRLEQLPLPDLIDFVRALWLPGELVVSGLWAVKEKVNKIRPKYIRLADGRTASAESFATCDLHVGPGTAPGRPPGAPSWVIPAPSNRSLPILTSPAFDTLLKVCHELNTCCFTQGQRVGDLRPTERQALAAFLEQFPAAVAAAEEAAADPAVRRFLDGLKNYLPDAVRWALAGDRSGHQNRYILGRELMCRVHRQIARLAACSPPRARGRAAG